MPTNKHASFRYRVLNECFRRPRYWTFEELLAELSDKMYDAFGTRQTVSKRTLQYDINVMRSAPPRGFDAPIECRDGGYFYADKTFSIEKKPLTEKDMAALREAMAVLRQFNGLPQFRMLADVAQRLDGWVHFPDRSAIQFETNNLVSGIQWLDRLYRSILDRTALEMTYQPFQSDKPLKLVFHPYHLREYRNRWFVFGYNDEQDSIYNLALDRIQMIGNTDKAYRPNTTFDPESYFRDIIGVTRPDDREPVEIIFRTTSLLSKYLLTKPLHASQQNLTQQGDRVDFSIRVIPNYEMYSEMARFGKALSILSPESVRQEKDAF